MSEQPGTRGESGGGEPTGRSDDERWLDSDVPPATGPVEHQPDPAAGPAGEGDGTGDEDGGRRAARAARRDAAGPAPALGLRGTGRWIWRQLTSMRTALLLLLLLAVAAVPGSLVPQRAVDRSAVERFFQAHPDLAPVYDRLGLFNVYSSVWFSAIYVLLMISLLGCIVPRIGVYHRALRTRPPRAPRVFSRMPESRRFETEESPETVLAEARGVLRRRRARVDVVGDELRAETGYLREAGNLVFHVSLTVVLVGVAAGGLYGYRGSAIVTEGGGFSNVLTQYDEFSSGALFSDSDLPPFQLSLDDFIAEFQATGEQKGAPRRFEARGTYTSEPGAKAEPYDITVNHPLTIDGTSIFVVGQGYAPVIRVTDADGEVVFDRAVPFLPQDATYTSTGVVKVPGAEPEQLGFQGFFLPTAARVDAQSAPISIFPGAANPTVGLFVYEGDLGLGDGQPQSVYLLDRSDLTQVEDAKGAPLRVNLRLDRPVTLPDGLGTIEFTDLRQFVRFQFSDTPGLVVPLIGTSVGVLGLMLSLYVRPRRTWVRVRRAPGGSRTVVEVASLDRIARGDLAADVDRFVERLQESVAPVPEDDPETGPGTGTSTTAGTTSTAPEST